MTRSLPLALLLFCSPSWGAAGKAVDIRAGSPDLARINVMRGASFLAPLTPQNVKTLQNAGVANLNLENLSLHAAAALEESLRDEGHVEALRQMGMTETALTGLRDLALKASAGRQPDRIASAVEAVGTAVPAVEIKGALRAQARLADLGERLRRAEQGASRPEVSLGVLADFFLGVAAKGGFADTATIFPKLRFAKSLDLGRPYEGWLRAVAFKGKRTVITGGMDGVIRLSGIHAGRSLRELKEHSGIIRALQLSPDKHYLFSADDLGMILRWNLRNLDAPPVVLRGITGQEVRALIISPDGRHLVSGGRGEVLVWDVRTGEESNRILGDQATYVLAIKDNGSFFAAGGDGTIRLVDMNTGAVLSRFEGHKKAVRALAFGPDKKTLVSAGEDKTIRTWNAETGEQLDEYLVKDGWVRSVRFQGDRMLLTGNINGWVGALGLGENGKIENTKPILKHDDVVFDALPSPKGDTIVSTGRDLRMGIYDIRRQRLTQMRGNGGPVYSLAFLDDGTLAGIGHDGALLVWPSINAAPRRIESHMRSGRAMAVAPGGIIATGGDDKRILLHSNQGEPRILEGHVARVRALAFSPDYRTLASGGDDRKLILWDVATGKEISRTELPRSIDVIHAIEWRPGGAELAIGGRDGRVWNLNVKTGRLSSWRKAQKSYIRKMAFNKDGSLLATAGRDGALWVWDALTGKPLRELSWHKDDVNSVEFDASSRYILTSSDDKTVRLLDHRTGELRYSKRGSRPISYARFIPGSSSILFVDDQRKIEIVDLRDVLGDASR